MNMLVEYLNLITAVVAILAAGYILAKINLQMRILSSGALLAFGMLHLDGIGKDMQILTSVIDIAIVVSLVYFATIANTLVNTDHPTSTTIKPTDRIPRKDKEYEPKTDLAVEGPNVSKR